MNKYIVVDGKTELSDEFCNLLTGWEPKIRPILFSTETVRAILDGRKTQTRRTIKPQPDDDGLHNHSKVPMHLYDELEGWHGTVDETGESKEFKAKADVGDIFWVRETWASSKALDRVKPKNILSGFPCEYKAGGTSMSQFQSLVDKGRWRPSIFMPKHACRLFLEVSNVRVERLQAIFENDAKKEGAKQGIFREGPNKIKNQFHLELNNHASYFDGFKFIWFKINGRESWDANPWVFAYDFKQIDRPKNFLR